MENNPQDESERLQIVELGIDQHVGGNNSTKKYWLKAAIAKRRMASSEPGRFA